MTFLSMTLLAGALFVLAATPGPGVLATVARAMASGFRPASQVVLGIVLGDVAFVLLAIFGLGALASLLGDLFIVVKLGGAAYLIWLGVQLWRRPDDVGPTPQTATTSGLSNWLSGLLITLANPKVILFYLGLLPTFIDLASLTALDIVIVIAIVALVLGATLLGYALAAARAREMIRHTRTVRLMNRTAGGVMILAGTALAAKG